MIDIKNPHSRNRLTLKEKFNKHFTDFIVPYIKWIDLNENWRTKSKYIPKVLKSARINIAGWEREGITTNEMPQDIDIDLVSLFVAEYIPIENVDKLNKGLKKLIKDYPYSFQYRQVEWVDEFCNDVKKSIRAGSWSPFGLIDFSKNKRVSEFVKHIHIQGTHFTSSSIILQFVIIPSEKFTKEYRNLLKRDITGGYSFDIKLKSFFKFWGGRSPSKDIVKNQMLEDLIIELKWRTMREIRKYFPLFFTKNSLIPPSIELYQVHQTSCVFKEPKNNKRNSFWRSIGMDNYMSDISKDGYWQLFMYRDSYLIDSSLKVTCNSKIKFKSMFDSKKSQITYMVNDFAEILLPIMVMREYALNLSEKIAIQQKQIFSSIKREKPKYSKLIKIRYELERSLHILKRFKNEINDDYFNNVKVKVNNLTGLELSKPRYYKMSATELYIGNANKIINETYEFSQQFAKMIDDTVQLLEIKKNHSSRKWSIWLTIISIVLALIATTFAGLSLFYQLDEDGRNKIIYLFSTLKEMWKNLFSK